MRVVATKVGFYRGSLRQPGTSFEFAESDMATDKETGKVKLPTWVVPAQGDGEAERKQIKAAKAAEEKRQRDGALAASGGKVAKDKVTEAQDLV